MRLTKEEHESLSQCEAILERSQRSFVEDGAALAKIRDGQLYRDTHDTFDDYCQERWEMSRFYASRIISSADVVQRLLPIGNKVELPSNESQARALSTLPEDEQADAWIAAVKAAEAEGKRVTALHVSNVVRSRMGKREPRSFDPWDYFMALEKAKEAVEKLERKWPDGYQAALAEFLISEGTAMKKELENDNGGDRTDSPGGGQIHADARELVSCDF